MPSVMPSEHWGMSNTTAYGWDGNVNGAYSSTQGVFTCLKMTTETRQKYVKSVQNQ